MATKPKFRSRKLDYKRPLPLYHAQELPDLDDDAHRAVPIVASGVEKEEEEEHHLQAVMSAAQTDNAEAANLYIPTPEASRLIDYYHEHYHRVFKEPKSLIRYSSHIEEAIGTPYCMDERDERWLEAYNASVQDASLHLTELQFEAVFSELEKITDSFYAVPSATELAELSDLDAFLLLEPEASSSVIKPALVGIYEHWKSLRLANHGKPLMARLKFDEAFKGETDPYICFRRREIRMTRKTRRTDAQSVQKLRQLRSEMETARTLLEMISRREKMRKEAVMLEHAIFQQKALIKSTKIELQVPDEVFEEARLARKRAAKIRSSPAAPVSNIKPVARKRKQSFTDDDSAFKDPLLIAIENEVNNRKLQNINWEDMTETTLSLPRQLPGFFTSDVLIDNTDIRLPRARRRIGRGGRLLYDRPHKPAHPLLANCPDSSDEENFSALQLTVEKLFTYKLLKRTPEDLAALTIQSQFSSQLPEEKAISFVSGVKKNKIRLPQLDTVVSNG